VRGALVPPTGLHLLLIRAVGAPIVLTGGDRSDEPDGCDRLAGMALSRPTTAASASATPPPLPQSSVVSWSAKRHPKGRAAAVSLPALLAVQVARRPGRNAMATLTIRDLDEELRARLRVRAAERGRSMEAEVREILRDSLAKPRGNDRLGSRIRQRFATLGRGRTRPAGAHGPPPGGPAVVIVLDTNVVSELMRLELVVARPCPARHFSQRMQLIVGCCIRVLHRHVRPEFDVFHHCGTEVDVVGHADRHLLVGF
jgi:antitoxin FitA